MTLATKLSEVGERLIAKFEADKIALEIDQVFEGDQERIPVARALCVETDQKNNTLIATSRKIQIELRVYIYLYITNVQSPQLNRKAVDEWADDIETYLHADPYLKRVDNSNMLIHSLVSEVSAGYAKKNGTLIRASRLTYTGLSQLILPQG